MNIIWYFLRVISLVTKFGRHFKKEVKSVNKVSSHSPQSAGQKMGVNSVCDYIIVTKFASFVFCDSDSSDGICCILSAPCLALNSTTPSSVSQAPPVVMRRNFEWRKVNRWILTIWLLTRDYFNYLVINT